ncbi:hypothetical protein [Burkholderia sp. BCC1998]|uniref:hypothetical protein n=1 Tax=Burkholderia sp. BCC1998 TaxID=2817447 RepID=UPI002AB7A890|nr:hypothetical protein [Burkholderia sp. BCC1998]
MKVFDYEIVSPERLIKFDKSPDFRGKPRVTPLPSTACRPFGVGIAPPAVVTYPRPALGTRSHRTVSSSDGLRPARAPRRFTAANPGQHGSALPPISIIVHVRRIIRPGFVNP